MLCGSAGKEQPLKPIAAAKNTRAALRLPFIIAMQPLAGKAMQQDSGCQFDISFCDAASGFRASNPRKKPRFCVITFTSN